MALAYAVGGGFGLEYDHPGTFQVEVLTKSVSTVDATKAAMAEIAGMNSDAVHARTSSSAPRAIS